MKLKKYSKEGRKYIFCEDEHFCSVCNEQLIGNSYIRAFYYKNKVKSITLCCNECYMNKKRHKLKGFTTPLTIFDDYSEYNVLFDISPEGSKPFFLIIPEIKTNNLNSNIALSEKYKNDPVTVLDKTKLAGKQSFDGMIIGKSVKELENKKGE